MFQTFIPSINAIFKDKNVDCVLFIFSVPRVPLQRMGGNRLEGFKIQMKVLKQVAEEFKKPCIIVAFGSRWIFDFVKDATEYSKPELTIPVMTRINQAIKAFRFMGEYNHSLFNNKK